MTEPLRLVALVLKSFAFTRLHRVLLKTLSNMHNFTIRSIFHRYYLSRKLKYYQILSKKGVPQTNQISKLEGISSKCPSKLPFLEHLFGKRDALQKAVFPASSISHWRFIYAVSRLTLKKKLLIRKGRVINVCLFSLTRIFILKIERGMRT